MIKRASARRMKSYYRILKTLIRLALIVLAGACVYHFGFGMAFDEAIYFCIVTGTTVGYGDVLTMTDNEKIFTIFFMLFGVAGVSQALGELIDIYVIEFTEQTIIEKVLLSTTYIHKCDLEGNGIISEAEYTVFKLQQMQKVDKDLMSRITATFNELDADDT